MDRFDSVPRDKCRTCNHPVSRRFRKVYGDGQDRVHRCCNCDTQIRVCAGSAAGKDVAYPDPLDQPERFDTAFSDLPKRIRMLVYRRDTAIVANG